MPEQNPTVFQFINGCFVLDGMIMGATTTQGALTLPFLVKIYTNNKKTPCVLRIKDGGSSIMTYSKLHDPENQNKRLVRTHNAFLQGTRIIQYYPNLADFISELRTRDILKRL